MCGRYTLLDDSDQIAQIFNIKILRTMPPRYNIAPSQEVLVVRMGENNEGEVAGLKWGLIPRWAKDPKSMPKPINAQSETAADKPYFRLPFRKNRCLIPTNGYYEWKAVGKIKQPYFIHMPNFALFFMAGLWEEWISPEGEVLETVTILTTSANALVSAFHDRMPVILPNRFFEMWLDRENHDVDLLSTALKPYEGTDLEFYAVSTLVNSGRIESEDCVRRLE